MDDKTSLHNDDPFNPAAEAANTMETTFAPAAETPPDEVMAALEMLAAFPDDPESPVQTALPAIEASSDAQPLSGPELETAAPEILVEPVPDVTTMPIVEAPPDTVEAAEARESDAARFEASWAIPTHAEHRDGRALSLSDDEQADEPFDTIEDGIASIFARLHAETQEAQDDEHEDEVTEADDAITFQLLGELDRLWHRAER
ncbi:hypothetical protein [Devosia sp.]|uniref:hypothetical protein n=1 Tax=Devosia sp. TaxID=1871048 RepID=UPI003BAA298A